MAVRTIPLAVALVLLLPALVLFLPSAGAATTRAVTITNASARPQATFAGFDGNPAKVFDINGDGKLEIIAQNDNQWVYVFNSQTGAIVAQMKTNFPAGWGARSFNGPEVAILADGGQPRLVVANSAATVTAYRFEPGSSTSATFAFTKLWERRLTACYGNPGMDSKPVLADLDKDGRLEILAGTEESGLYALRDDGTLYWKNCLGGGNAEPTVGDLNQDGWPDVVHVSDGGVVSALNGRTGAWMWSFNIKSKYNLSSGSMPVGATIAQLNGVGGPDVVVGARDSHDAVTFGNNHAVLFALDSAGKFLWGYQDPTGNPLTYTHPIVVDAASDGNPEVYWADWNTMGHKPGNWQVTGPGHFYRFDQSGNRVWRQTLDTWWANKDLAVADVDADGVQEVLANGPNAGHDGIWYLDSRTGAKESFVDAYPYQVSRGPVVADLWNTGTMQFVVEAGSAILVFDTHVAYDSAWPHLPYVTRNPTGPPPPTLPPPSSTPPPPSSPPPASSSPPGFSAAYEVPPGVNEWWVEVKVTSNQTVASVDARVNAGEWTALARTSWGTWAKSFFVPAGSQVQFRSTSSTGAQNLSQTFAWLSGGFKATFEPRSQTNNWWVEVKVTSGDPITRVDASVNDGAWTQLNPTTWGTWAKSFFVADGSQVRFRATNDEGAQVVSGSYAWG